MPEISGFNGRFCFGIPHPGDQFNRRVVSTLDQNGPARHSGLFISGLKGGLKRLPQPLLAKYR